MMVFEIESLIHQARRSYFLPKWNREMSAAEEEVLSQWGIWQTFWWSELPKMYAEFIISAEETKFNKRQEEKKEH